jgi:hypothetical protein
LGRIELFFGHVVEFNTKKYLINFKEEVMKNGLLVLLMLLSAAVFAAEEKEYGLGDKRFNECKNARYQW